MTVDAPRITEAVGSVAGVDVPGPVTRMISVDPLPPSAPEGLSSTFDSGAVGIAASMSSQPGDYSVDVTGSGCAFGGCGNQITVHVPVTVVPIEAPPGSLEDFSDPSPDRLAQASEYQLQDELLVMMGTTDEPGTRAQADAAAAAVGGVVSGGLTDVGIYQIRWDSPQDLAARTTQLQSQPGVTGVTTSKVGLYGAQSAYTGTVSSDYDHPEYTWRYDQVHALQAWAQSKGSDVTVGIIDQGNVFSGHDDLDVTRTLDHVVPRLHATHVAGLACARPNNAGMVGLAWGCPIVSTSAGVGDVSGPEMMAAMDRMARTPDVQVVNASLGAELPCGSSAELQGEVRAYNAHDRLFFRRMLAGRGSHIVWTFSAGNSCISGSDSPWGDNSDLPNVLSVAATNADSRLASFSNFGVEVAAPGGVVPSQPPTDQHSVRCTAPAAHNDGKCGLLSTEVVDCPQGFCSSYGELAGTSMAAPIVAGIAADVIEAHPAKSAGQIGDCITNSAGTGGVDSTRPPDGQPAGFGSSPYDGDAIPIVNADAAVKCAPSTTPTSPATALQVSTGGPADTCAIRSDHTVACWGDNEWGEAEPPSGAFDSVSLGGLFACGIDDAHQIECWGGEDDPGGAKTTPPSGSFRSLSAGARHSCAIRLDNTLACWGNDSTGETDAPSGTFQAVSVASAFDNTCAVRSNGALACWGGDDQDGRLDPPPGSYKAVSTGERHSCAIAADDTVACWGTDDFGDAEPPSGTFKSVSVGGFYSCGVRSDDSLTCWGDITEGGGVGPSFVAGPPNGTFQSVSAGQQHACAVRVNGNVVCWGLNYDGEATPPVGAFTSVSRGGDHTCAINVDGKVECWGFDSYGEADPPPGDFKSISAGFSDTCGIRSDDTLSCWGATFGGVNTPPTGSFVAVSVGSSNACAIRTDSTLACWGDNYQGTATPPTGTFDAVSVGAAHACGIRTDGSLVCWGSNGFGDPPSGQFVALATQRSWSSGSDCGIRANGTLVCWGPGDQASPTAGMPAGTFLDLSLSSDTACAIRTAGDLACWGNGQPKAVPAGSFTMLSGGGDTDSGIYLRAPVRSG